MKKIYTCILTILLSTPLTALAINPTYYSKGQSIGSIFREIFAETIALYIAFPPFTLIASAVIAIPALTLGLSTHRKHIARGFFILFPIVFFGTILLDDPHSALSNALKINIYWFFYLSLTTISAFLISTLRFRKKNIHRHKKADYIPLLIIIAIFFLLMFAPIRTGNLLCKTPLINQWFTCTWYGPADLSWFVF